MTDTSTLQNLLTRVEAATGGSRDIDSDLEQLAYGQLLSPAMRNTSYGQYSYSIDAALALVDRLLPGRGYRLYKTGTPVDANAWWFSIYGLNDKQKMKRRPTAPLAILAALLKALIAQAGVSP